MSRIDLNKLLKEISPEEPSGEKVSSVDLSELERNRKPKIDPTGKILSEPRWSDVQKTALELLGKTHDIRIAVILARALVDTQGFAGFYDALKLIRGFIEQYWETVYPQLDVEENNDPTERINALWELNSYDEFIDPIMRIPLCNSAKMGHYSLRDIHIANKTLKPVTTNKDKEDEPPGLNLIEAAFKDSDPETLRNIQIDSSNALKEVKALDKVLEKKIESDNSVQLNRLIKVLEDVDNVMADRIGKGSDNPDANEAVETSEIPETNQHTPSSGPIQQGVITSRDDIIRMLDRICDYYAENEPASPVPLLLQRAGRLVKKNFVEILEDMAPDSVKQIQSLIGVSAESEKESE